NVCPPPVNPAGRGSGGALGETPNGLDANATLAAFHRYCQCYFRESPILTLGVHSPFGPRAQRKRSPSRRCASATRLPRGLSTFRLLTEPRSRNCSHQQILLIRNKMVEK